MACSRNDLRALGPRSRANACSLSSTTPKSAPPTIRIVGACKGFVLDELHWFCGSDPPVSGVSSTLTPKGPLVTWLRRAAAEGGRLEWRNQNPSGSHYLSMRATKVMTNSARAPSGIDRATIIFVVGQDRRSRYDSPNLASRSRANPQKPANDMYAPSATSKHLTQGAHLRSV